MTAGGLRGTPEYHVASRRMRKSPSRRVFDGDGGTRTIPTLAKTVITDEIYVRNGGLL